MIFIHIRHYSDYGSFQRVFGVMGMFIDLSLNNASHVIIQWINGSWERSWEDGGQMLEVISWKFSSIPALFEPCVIMRSLLLFVLNTSFYDCTKIFTNLHSIYRVGQIRFTQRSDPIRYRNKLRFDSCHLNLQPLIHCR